MHTNPQVSDPLLHQTTIREPSQVSDGHYDTDQRREGQQRQDRLRATGCAVLWLTPNSASEPMDGATVHQLSDPTTTAQAIGRAATAALRATR